MSDVQEQIFDLWLWKLALVIQLSEDTTIASIQTQIWERMSTSENIGTFQNIKWREMPAATPHPQVPYQLVVFWSAWPPHHMG